MKTSLHHTISLIVCAALALTLSLPVHAVEISEEQTAAAAQLQLRGLMAGDEYGDLHLDEMLTRAELACLISPIVLNPEHVTPACQNTHSSHQRAGRRISPKGSSRGF